MTESKVGVSVKKALRELDAIDEKKKREEEERKKARRRETKKKREAEQKLHAAIGRVFLDAADGKGDFASFQQRCVVELRDAILAAPEETEEETSSDGSPGTEGGETSGADNGHEVSHQGEPFNGPEGW